MIIYNPNIDDIQLTPLIGFDTEFNNLDTKHAKLIAFSITNEFGETYTLDVNLYVHKILVEFFNRIAELKVVICHNAKADISVVYSNLGVLLKNGWCTMLASQIVDNGYGIQVSKNDVDQLPANYENGKLYYTGNMVGNIKYMVSPHGLIGTVQRYLGKTIGEQGYKKLMQQSFINYDFKNPLTQEQLKYAAEDTVYLIPLYKAQLLHIEERSLGKIIQLENRLTPVLIKMEFRGCKIDVALHKQNIIKWKQKLEEITTQLDGMLIVLSNKYKSLKTLNTNRTKTIINQTSLFGPATEIILQQDCINYSSTKQLAEIFTICKQELPTKDDKTSFGEETIAFYVTNNPDSEFIEFLELLLVYREYEKLIGTYSDKIIDNLDGDRIRTSYSQCWTATGRLSSSEIKEGLGINLANIPKNPDIRKIFIPDDGCVFVDSDMTGQELVIAGDFSGEPVLLKAFQDKFDHHSFLASISYSIVFGRPIEIKNINETINVDGIEYDVKKLRDVHKVVLFSKIYLGGPKRIQGALNKYLVKHVPAKERFQRCKQISAALDETLTTLIGYLKSKVEETKYYGYTVANKLGRRRYFDNPNEVYGDAANMPIQGSGADAMKIAMINIDKFFDIKSRELNIPAEKIGYLTMSIYDQVLVNLNKEFIEYKDQIPIIMGEAITFFLTTLKGTSDLHIREFWGK